MHPRQSGRDKLQLPCEAAQRRRLTVVRAERRVRRKICGGFGKAIRGGVDPIAPSMPSGGIVPLARIKLQG
jgi:hypothetical protein